MRIPILFLVAGLALAYLSKSQPTPDRQSIKTIIINLEASFCADLKARGAAWAFQAYAAPDAVIKRENDTLVRGRKGIFHYYSKDLYKQAVADWKPDFVDVSADGTMAYTYGKYTWTFKDQSGKPVQYSGIFHTVWKKQPNGQWKYVWD
jgi:ketosteroid isomerase-like protein